MALNPSSFGTTGVEGVNISDKRLRFLARFVDLYVSRIIQKVMNIHKLFVRGRNNRLVSVVVCNLL